jgi:hypothetical protein
MRAGTARSARAADSATSGSRWSGGRWVKFSIRIKVGVAYGSDFDEVVALL